MRIVFHFEILSCVSTRVVGRLGANLQPLTLLYCGGGCDVLIIVEGSIFLSPLIRPHNVEDTKLLRVRVIGRLSMLHLGLAFCDGNRLALLLGG